MPSELFINRILLPTRAWVLICLPLLGIILEASERMCRPNEGTFEPSDDFEAFYLDLHRFATDVDFTRREAEGLYSVWQRQRVAKKEETNI